LFAQRPAPIQASWLAYPCTTGLSGIDYLIMDSDMAPGAAERWCSEAVVRLPYGRLCYAPPDYAPDVVQLDRRPDQPITFASFNAIAKIGSEVVRLWTKVLAAAPGSRLLLKGEALTEPSVRWRLTQAFVAAGLDRKRLELRAASPHAQVLADHSEVDVALDPFPFGGGLTSLEALWMGVPVVTLPGERPASRQTLSFLRVLGLGDLVAMSQADYVRIAAGLAADPRRRALLRGALRARMAASPLCNGALFTPTLESAYRQMWRRWCAGQSATALNIRA
jgi:predicted O-linked N-acetylglucosamine transferase (SPINDLY family)